MESEIEEEIIALAAASVLIKRTKRRRKRPKFHINPYLQLRNIKGRFASDVSC